MHWRRKWQPTPVFLPGESRHGGTWWVAVYGFTQSRMDRSDLAAAAAALHITHSRLSLSSVNHPQIQPTTYDVQFSSVAQ